jgi:Cu(I)/Ag(I) efflux system membrane protein CusA/SilA
VRSTRFVEEVARAEFLQFLRTIFMPSSAWPTRDDLYAAIMTGVVERVRPKTMTIAAIMAGLLPIMWSHGTGAEVMQWIAVPMIGGMISSTLLTLIVIPALYAVVKSAAVRRPVLAAALPRS